MTAESPRSRNDYAEAAARALTEHATGSNRVYELAGDQSFTLAECAAEIARQTSRTIVYHNLPQAAYVEALTEAGLPPAIATMLGDSSTKTGQGALYGDSHQLSQLIGRATTPLAQTIATALRAAPPAG